MSRSLLSDQDWRHIARIAGAIPDHPQLKWPRHLRYPTTARLLSSEKSFSTIDNIIEESFIDVLQRLRPSRDAIVLEISSDVTLLSLPFSRYLSSKGRYYLLHPDDRVVYWFNDIHRGDHRMSATTLCSNADLSSLRAQQFDCVIDSVLLNAASATVKAAATPFLLSMHLELSRCPRYLLAPLVEYFPLNHGLDLSWTTGKAGPFSADIPYATPAKPGPIKGPIFDEQRLRKALNDCGLLTFFVYPPIKAAEWLTSADTWCARLIVHSAT